MYKNTQSKRDVVFLFTTRIIRLFAYGFLSVILALYLAEIGFTESQIGLLLTVTLMGDAVISLGLTTTADRLGRRRMLIIGAVLMVFAGLVFIFTRQPLFLALAAIIGVISPSGNEVGPFLSIEQAALSQLLPADQRTHFFAWYNLAGSFATAAGALSGGGLLQILQSSDVPVLHSYQIILLAYALSGAALSGFFMAMSPNVEASQQTQPVSGLPLFGLRQSKNIVFKLSGLFALDAFAGGFIVQSILAYWFHLKFGVSPGALGGIFFGANLLAGVSALLAVRLAAKIGLINTMVFTHIPSNILLLFVPLMPNLSWAIGLLLTRYSISQMDVPTRQSYLMAVVPPEERSAAAGVTTIARSIGASISPSLCGLLLANPALMSVPFFLTGTLKIIYDLLLYRSFKAMKPPEEKR